MEGQRTLEDGDGNAPYTNTTTSESEQYGGKGSSRKKTKRGRYISDVTLDEILQCTHLPAHMAAEKIGLGLTSFKRLCRQFGIISWPYKPSLSRQNQESADEVGFAGQMSLRSSLGQNVDRSRSVETSNFQDRYQQQQAAGTSSRSTSAFRQPSVAEQQQKLKELQHYLQSQQQKQEALRTHHGSQLYRRFPAGDASLLSNNPEAARQATMELMNQSYTPSIEEQVRLHIQKYGQRQQQQANTTSYHNSLGQGHGSSMPADILQALIKANAGLTDGYIHGTARGIQSGYQPQTSQMPKLPEFLPKNLAGEKQHMDFQRGMAQPPPSFRSEVIRPHAGKADANSAMIEQALKELMSNASNNLPAREHLTPSNPAISSAQAKELSEALVDALQTLRQDSGFSINQSGDQQLQVDMILKELEKLVHEADEEQKNVVVGRKEKSADVDRDDAASPLNIHDSSDDKAKKNFVTDAGTHDPHEIRGITSATTSKDVKSQMAQDGINTAQEIVSYDPQLNVLEKELATESKDNIVLEPFSGSSSFKIKLLQLLQLSTEMKRMVGISMIDDDAVQKLYNACRLDAENANLLCEESKETGDSSDATLSTPLEDGHGCLDDEEKARCRKSIKIDGTQIEIIVNNILNSLEGLKKN